MTFPFSKRNTLPQEIEGSKTPSDSSIPIPKKIGPYVIESFFERGGMSLLYLGRLPGDPQPVLVKVLTKRFLGSPDVVKRFLAEAEIVAITDHPNIVRLHQSGQWEGGLYIAMEFIQGSSLRQYLQNVPLSLKRALEIILEIAYALCHLHTHHVIHRDLKPENILITHEGKVKVIDFGIAQLLYSRVKGVSTKKQIIGTPIYMSPEQREDPEEVSYPSDIYSLGIVAYELIIGRISQSQIHLSFLPKGIQKIIAKTLQPKPEDRYHDIVDFISDLSHYLHSPVLDKDLKPIDSLIESYDTLKNRVTLWQQPKIPLWEGYKIKMSYDPFPYFPRLSWDFFDNETHHGLVLFEQAESPLSNIMALSWVKGLLDANKELYEHPEKLAYFLNQRLMRSPDADPILFACLSIHKKNHYAQFLSAGAELIHLTQDGFEVASENQIALGVEDSFPFKSTVLALKENESLLIHPGVDILEGISLKGSIDSIFHDMKHLKNNPLSDRPPYLFSISRI